MSISKITQAILCLSILATTIHAQDALRDKFLKEPEHSTSRPIKKPDSFFKPFGRGFYVSTGICIGGGLADIATTSRELNPLLRNQSGGLSIGRALLFKSAACGWPVLIERKHPRAAFWARVGAGVVWSLAAVRNVRQ
jgi:hypothetical protein